MNNYKFRRRTIICLITAAFSLQILNPTEARSSGWGFYGMAGTGSANVDGEVGKTPGSVSESALQKTTDRTGFGIVFDTAVTNNELFNYRLSLGYETFEFSPGEGDNYYDLKGFVWTNDFGFGIIRKDIIRLWAGPELKISYSTGTDSYQWMDMRVVSLSGLGLGPVIGVNFNIQKTLSIGLKTGYIYNYYTGVGTAHSSTNGNADYSITEQFPFVNFSLMFVFDEK